MMKDVKLASQYASQCAYGYLVQRTQKHSHRTLSTRLELEKGPRI